LYSGESQRFCKHRFIKNRACSFGRSKPGMFLLKGTLWFLRNALLYSTFFFDYSRQGVRSRDSEILLNQTSLGLVCSLSL